MSQYDPPTFTKDAEAASEGDHLFVFVIPPPDHQDTLTLTFFGTYDDDPNVTSDRKELLHAEGVLTFNSSLKAGDEARFTVKVTEAQAGDPDDTKDVEVDITGLDSVNPGVGSAIFKGKGDLREGEGYGEWQTRKNHKKNKHHK